MTTAAAELIATWAARDRHYALRRHHGLVSPLSPTERRIVRTYRLREIEALPARERAQAWAAWQGMVGGWWGE